MRRLIAAPPNYRFKPNTCPRCSKRNKQTENVTAPSPGISQASGTAALVPHEEKTPIQRKQMCTECGKPRWKSEWCSNEHFETTTGYCNECAMICSTCQPEPTLRKKEEYNETHWKNVKKCSACLHAYSAKQQSKQRSSNALDAQSMARSNGSISHTSTPRISIIASTRRC